MGELLFINTESGHRIKIADPKRMPTRIYINKQQTSEMIGIAVSTLNQWIANRKIDYIKLDKRVLFDVRDVIAFIEARRVPAKK